MVDLRAGYEEAKTAVDDPKVVALGHLRATYALLNSRLADVVQQEAGISLDAFEVLDAISKSTEGRLRLGDLADQVSLTRSGLTRRLDRLERDGLITRESCLDDRRGAVAIATEKGKALLAKAIAPYHEAVRTHFGAKITEGEARQLSAVMRRVSESLLQTSTIRQNIDLR